MPVKMSQFTAAVTVRSLVSETNEQNVIVHVMNHAARRDRRSAGSGWLVHQQLVKRHGRTAPDRTAKWELEALVSELEQVRNLFRPRVGYRNGLSRYR